MGKALLDELKQQHAKLEKALAEDKAVREKAVADFFADLPDIMTKIATEGLPFFKERPVKPKKKNSVKKRTKEIQKELDKVKKKAWKWYGVAL